MVIELRILQKKKKKGKGKEKRKDRRQESSIGAKLKPDLAKTDESKRQRKKENLLIK